MAAPPQNQTKKGDLTMFVVKLKPITTLAVQWDGTNLEEVEGIFNSVHKNCDNSLSIDDHNSIGIIVPLNWFAIKYESTVLVLDNYDFYNLCSDYFNPHEVHTTEEGSKEVEDDKPDPDFITFM